MRNRLPGKKYEKWMSLGGEVEVRINPASKDGVFQVYADGEWFSDNDLDRLKGAINRHYHANIVLEYSPVIVIVRDGDKTRWGKNILFNIIFERYFVAEHPTVGKQYFCFEVKWPHGHSHFDIPAREILAGEPGAKTHRIEKFRGTEKIIPYTPDKWACLVKLMEKHNEIKQRVEEVLQSDELEDLLERISLNLIEYK